MSEASREDEEDYLRALTSHFDINLYFVDSDMAFTDGVNICVDPRLHGIYKEKWALERACVHVGLPKNLLADDYAAIKFVSRGLELHEAYHVLYTRFDLSRKLAKDKRAITAFRRKLLLDIDNIIEDAFIERAGAAEFDNTGHYFKILSTTILLLWQADILKQKNNPSVEEQDMAPITPEDKKILKNINFINTFLNIANSELRSDARIGKISPPALAKLYAKAKPLFFAGAIECDPVKRIDYSRQIFDLLKRRLPKITDERYEEIIKMEPVVPLIPCINAKTHDGVKKTPSMEPEKRVPAKVNPPSNHDGAGNDGGTGNHDNVSHDPKKLTVYLTPGHCSAAEIEEARKLINKFIEQGKMIEYVEVKDGYEIKSMGKGLHEGITVTERKYPSDGSCKTDYRTIAHRNSLLIEKFKRRFYRELARSSYVRAEKLTLGRSIMSNRLWDVKGRYWVGSAPETVLPDIAVMLFIDGSGSMQGAKKANAIFASVVLCEVLEKNKVTFAVVEHRGDYNGSVDINVLRPFKAKPQDKYNILRCDAYGGTRDGLTLLWAMDYFKKHTYAEKRLLIAITDGLPEDKDYEAPVSHQDTKASVTALKKAGIETVALALVNDSYELSAIETIYDNIALCGNAEELPSKIMEVVGRIFR